MKHEFEEFDLLDSPIYKTNLIEANAGTGKTYTITALFLRLLIERGLDADNILAVTFTQAAAYELKERIRSRIYDAVTIFSYDKKLPDNIKENLQNNDPFLFGLYERQTDKKKAFKLLNAALRNFDLASIFTIHGFCRRILYENTFESGGLFDTTLVTENASFLMEIAEDFWRKYTYNLPPLFANYLKKSISVNLLYRLIKDFKMSRCVEILPDPAYIEKTESVNERTIERDYNNILGNVGLLWEKERNNIKDILENEKGLNRNKYRKNGISYLIDAMDDFTSLTDNPFLFDKFIKFTSDEIEASTKKGFEPAAHSFFDLCGRLAAQNKKLCEIFDADILKLKLKLITYLSYEHKKRKKNLNICFFDDLIADLHNALHGKSGNKLADKIRERFKVAMIDEFQDTDPLQYQIFCKIFGKKIDYPLFLIGDPKQAIYGFRGADIFTYIKAAKNTDKKYTLTKNRRSTFSLIKAVNSIFGNNPDPFLYEDISFIPSSYPYDRTENETFTIDGIEESGIKICCVEPKESKPNQEEVKEIISRYFADNIANLLNMGKEGRALIGNNRLEAKDIAVLVRKNKEAYMIQKDLFALDIKSILHNTENIFETEDAYQTALLLDGIIDYENSSAVKSALAGKMFGLTSKDIYNLFEDETSWEKRKESFREYNRIWKNRGFIRMFNYMAQKEKFFPNLIIKPDGERKITNMLHLMEILNKFYIEKKMNIFELVKLLKDKIAASYENTAEDEALLRLESDENAVTIITIHKSKGLEYPIVFSPFLSADSEIRGKIQSLKFHDRNGSSYLDIGSKNFEINKKTAEKEILAENIRLLYVAATRAKYLCYMGWRNAGGGLTSSQAFLFHNQKPLSSDNIIREVKDAADKKDGNELYNELKRLEKISEQKIEILEIKESEDKTVTASPVENSLAFEPSPRHFSGKISKDWGISSFTSITSNMTEQFDSINPFYNDDETIKTAFFRSERGARFGTFLHYILEHTDFSSKIVSSSIFDKLMEYGYSDAIEPAVFNMIEHLVLASLDTENKDLVLSRIENKKRMNEFEFYFPIKPIFWSDLSILFEDKFGYDKRIKNIKKNTIKGFMRGFIDMVFMYEEKFYIIDWKSNYLGENINDYNQNAILSSMLDHHYILQYHIYTAALSRYLNAKIEDYDYEKYFGKVFYIFLRGINKDKSPEFGVFSDRPSKDVITKLNDLYFVSVEKESLPDYGIKIRA